MRPFLKILQYNDQDVFSPYMKICNFSGLSGKLGKTVGFPLVGKTRKITFMEFVKGAIRKWVRSLVSLEAKMLCVYMKLQTRPCTHLRMAPFKYTTSLYKEETSWSTYVKIDKNNTRYPQYRGYISCYWLIAGLNCIS